MNRIIEQTLLKLEFIVLLIVLTLNMFSCKQNKTLLCDYGELNCAYYVEDTYVNYKYSDYIVDDITNGEYKKPTPSIADYRYGSNPLDIDIPSYVNARMDYAIKNEMIKKYEARIDDFCDEIREGEFKQRNSIIYFNDKATNEMIKLNEDYATNISYDDEIPMVSFDTNDELIEDKSNEIKKMHLSDILAENLTIDGYMKIILGQGKKRQKFMRDEENIVD